MVNVSTISIVTCKVSLVSIMSKIKWQKPQPAGGYRYSLACYITGFIHITSRKLFKIILILNELYLYTYKLYVLYYYIFILDLNFSLIEQTKEQRFTYTILYKLSKLLLMLFLIHDNIIYLEFRGQSPCWSIYHVLKYQVYSPPPKKKCHLISSYGNCIYHTTVMPMY